METEGANPISPSAPEHMASDGNSGRETLPRIRGTIVERGEDFAVHRNLIPESGPDGTISWRTSEFTRIAHAMHYLEDGVWKESSHVLERQPDGRVAALRGPHKVWFSPDTSGDRVFEVRTSSGRRFAGGIRALRLRDERTDEVRLIARVRDGVPGTLKDGSEVRFPDAFDALHADVVYVWRRDAFLQDVILRERPELPDGWDPARTRFEVLTEFETSAPAEVRFRACEPGAGGARADAALIRLGGMTVTTGHAFAVADERALRVGPAHPEAGSEPVRKEWLPSADGRNLLVESIPWRCVEEHLDARGPRRVSSPLTATPRQTTRSGAPDDPAGGARSAEATRARALVVDFIIVPESKVTFFPQGMTFYVQSPYTVTEPVTFQRGTVVKLADNAFLALQNEITSSEGSLRYAVFTSRDDDLHGEWIGNVPGEEDSTGNPAAHRPLACLQILHPVVPTRVEYVRLRWAQRGIRYVAPEHTHILFDAWFEHCTYGLDAANVPPERPVRLDKVRQVGVTQPASGQFAGRVHEAIANASVAPHNQAEPAIAVRALSPSNPYETKVVIVALSRQSGTGRSDVGMYRVSSGDGGLTWPTRGYIATGEDGLPRADGDADPSLAYDAFGNLFLAYRSAQGGAAVCAVSSNDGQTWSVVNGFSGAGYGGATPRLAVSPKLGHRCVIWLLLQSTTTAVLQCAATESTGLGAEHVARKGDWAWSGPLLDGQPGKFHSIATGPAGEVMVVMMQGSPPYTGEKPVTFRTLRNASGFPSMTFEHVASADFTVENMGMTFLDLTAVDAMPVLAWDRPRNRLYLSYTTRAPGAVELDTDVAVRTFRHDVQQWSDEILVSRVTSRSQFHPWVAVDEATGLVALIWFDTREDPAGSEAHVYAALSRDGFQGSNTTVIRLTTTPASGVGRVVSLKEYIGAACWNGFLYPAFPNPGIGPDGAWDIFSGRIPF